MGWLDDLAGNVPEEPEVPDLDDGKVSELPQFEPVAESPPVVRFPPYVPPDPVPYTYSSPRVRVAGPLLWSMSLPTLLLTVPWWARGPLLWIVPTTIVATFLGLLLTNPIKPL